MLLGSIEAKDKQGKVAFSMVKKTMKVNDGYASGDFKKAWKAMNTKYEDTDIVSKADLKKEYYALMMEEDELPSYFILTMEEMRIILEEIAGVTIDDDEFKLDILSKLPEGKEGELGPYQVERRLIEPKIKDKNTTYKIEELSRDLDRLYNSLNKKEAKAETKKTPEREQLELAYKVMMKRHFKGRCRKCGVFGHKAADCRKKVGNGNRAVGYEGNKGKGPPGNFNKKAIKCNNSQMRISVRRSTHLTNRCLPSTELPR